MYHTVSVKYKYGSCYTSGSYRVQGKTESAIMSHLRKIHGNVEILILDYVWVN